MIGIKKEKVQVAALLIGIFFGGEVLAQRKMDSRPPQSPPPSPFSAFVEIQPTVTTSGTVPLWMRARQYGSVPPSGWSSNFLAGVKKNYVYPSKKLLDYGFSVEGRLNVGTKTEWILPEAYAKGRLWIFELKAGRSKDFMGLVDSTLSAGAFAVSGNALGIPKLTLSVPEYYVLPFLGRMFAFKGTFSHGWLGTVPASARGTVFNVQTYFHQKSFYGRFGKEKWRWKVFGGFNHQVVFGNEKTYLGNGYDISEWETYRRVVFGKTFGTNAIGESKVGNALGSIDVGLQYNFKKIQVFAYRQFFYDIGALGHLANVRDGLYGLSISNKSQPKKGGFRLEKIVLEYFTSIDQAGYPWSIHTPSGDEDYYNNYIYRQGWSYQGLGMGNPLISRKAEVRSDAVTKPGEAFVNNRVTALYLGSAFSFLKLDFTVKLSYSRNYGTFATSEYGSSVGTTFFPPVYGVFEPVDQFCSYLEINKKLKRGFRIGTTMALDQGNLYYNSTGLMLKAAKVF